ncbi:MAG: histidine kinase [Sphingobacteriales bacterium]|nr:histidine kinase [Sphingobacteriales bacterium]
MTREILLPHYHKEANSKLIYKKQACEKQAYFLHCFIKVEMKNWLNKIYNNRYFILFIMFFAYVQSIFIRATVWEEINAYTFTPEALFFSLYYAGILFAIILAVLKKRKQSDIFSVGGLLKAFGLSLILYLIAMKVCGFFISFAFNTVERNFNQKTFLYTMFSDFLNGLIYGSFFLAYYYYKKNKTVEHQLSVYHQAIAENKIHLLKSQLNPHFLFNNLNVLDQFIAEDKNKASGFLNRFSEIYRYVLQSSEKKIISLKEEINFAEEYFRLIQYKYENAYQMIIEGKSNDGYIVPLTLQLLIENAIQHNLGTQENPVVINIVLTDKISITNNIKFKKSSKQTNGRALSNLKEQYKLLTRESIGIYQSASTFSVIIPIIYT